MRRLGVSLAILLGFWQGAASFAGVSQNLLPTPWQVAVAFVGHWEALLREGLVTATTSLLGIVCGGCVAVASASLIVVSRPARAVLEPLLVVSQTFPLQALAPPLILWFGFGLPARVITSALICFFPLAISTLYGLRSLDRDLCEYAAGLGATRLQRFAKFQFPAALPAMASGLKVAATLSVVGTVVGEFVSAREGLGRVILFAQRTYETEMMFAALLALSAIGVVLYTAAAGIEVLLSRARRTRREG